MVSGANDVSGDNVTPSTSATSRPRLSGAARKRFRRLMAANMEVDEARKMCRIPLNQMPPELLSSKMKVKKRFHSEEEPRNERPENIALSNPGAGSSKPTPKLVAGSSKPSPGLVAGSSKPSPGLVAGSSRVGIRNKEPMSAEQMTKVRAALLRSILAMEPRPGTGPKFLGFAQKNGWVMVICADAASEEWLVNQLRTLKPWEGAELSLIPESDLPKPIIVSTFLPNTETTSVEQALALIFRQNVGLDTRQWKLLHVKDDVEGGRVATFAVDDMSADTIRKAQGKVLLGFKSISFRIRGESQPVVVGHGTPVDQAEAGSSASTATQVPIEFTKEPVFEEPPFYRRGQSPPPRFRMTTETVQNIPQKRERYEHLEDTEEDGRHPPNKLPRW